MLKELIKAKERFIYEFGEYPTAVSLSKEAHKELVIECKSLRLTSAKGYTGKRINGCIIFVDEEQKEPIIFGYETNKGFYREAF